MLRKHHRPGLILVIATAILAALLLQKTIHGQDAPEPTAVSSEEAPHATTGATKKPSRDTRLKPENEAKSLYQTARGDMSRKMYDAALVRLDEAIKLDPAFVEAHYLRAITHMRLGEHGKALEDLDRALALKIGDKRLKAGCYYIRGVLNTELGEDETAITDFELALELVPDHELVYVKRGQAYGRLGMYEEALHDLRRAVEIDPDLAEELAAEMEWYEQSLELKEQP